MQTLKRELTPVAINHPLEPRESGRHQGRHQGRWTPAAADLPDELSGKTKQTSSADEILWAKMFPFSQLSPDICRETVAVGRLAQQRTSKWLEVA